MIKKALTAVLCAVLLTGCSYFDGEEQVAEETPTPTPTPTQQVTYTPKQNGTLKVAMRNPKTLNPLLNADVTVNSVLRLLFEPLMELNEEQYPVPRLADRMEVAPDGMSITVFLKDNICWSDGEAITAKDLIYSIEVLRNDAEENAVYKESVRNISLCREVDEKTVKINLSQSFGGMAYLLCFPLIPEHYYNTDADLNMNPLGNGLYKFESYTQSNKLELTRSINAMGKEPYINNVTALITSDVETDLYSFEQSIIDVVSSNISEWAKYSGHEGTEITDYITTYYDFIGFNFKNEILKKKEVRQAIAYALPLDTIVDESYPAHAVRTLSIVNPESWLYEPDVATYTYDAEKAASIAKVSSEPISLRLLVNVENNERVKIAEAIKTKLNEVGFQIEVISVDFNEYNKLLEKKDFDIFVGGFSLSPVPDFTFALHSSGNYFSYSDKQMDELLEQVFYANDDASFKKALSKVQKHMAEELPCISIAFRKSALLSSGSVKGDIKPIYSNMFYNVEQWFIVD